MFSMWEEEVEFHFCILSRWQLFYCNRNVLVVPNLFTIAQNLMMCIASLFVTDPSWTLPGSFRILSRHLISSLVHKQHWF